MLAPNKHAVPSQHSREHLLQHLAANGERFKRKEPQLILPAIDAPAGRTGGRDARRRLRPLGLLLRAAGALIAARPGKAGRVFPPWRRAANG